MPKSTYPNAVKSSKGFQPLKEFIKVIRLIRNKTEGILFFYFIDTAQVSFQSFLMIQLFQ